MQRNIDRQTGRQKHLERKKFILKVWIVCTNQPTKYSSSTLLYPSTINTTLPSTTLGALVAESLYYAFTLNLHTTIDTTEPQKETAPSTIFSYFPAICLWLVLFHRRKLAAIFVSTRYSAGWDGSSEKVSVGGPYQLG